jgi:hypothetical protein
MLRADPDERPDVFEVLEKLAELRGKHYIRKIVWTLFFILFYQCFFSLFLMNFEL